MLDSRQTFSTYFDREPGVRADQLNRVRLYPKRGAALEIRLRDLWTHKLNGFYPECFDHAIYLLA
ncbi:MAG: hypothetical protein AAGA46_00435 [Cyanobacteria bacterium P01_F01_bin.13]